METNLDGLYKTNRDMETEGNWFEVADGVAFKIKRFGGYNSPEIKKAVAKYHKPHALMISKGLLPDAKEREIHTRAFVESSIVDWKGITIGDEVAEFTVDKAVEMLVGLPDLVEVLMQEASNFENYREELGNS